MNNIILTFMIVAIAFVCWFGGVTYERIAHPTRFSCVNLAVEAPGFGAYYAKGSKVVSFGR